SPSRTFPPAALRARPSGARLRAGALAGARSAPSSAGPRPRRARRARREHRWTKPDRPRARWQKASFLLRARAQRGAERLRERPARGRLRLLDLALGERALGVSEIERVGEALLALGDSRALVHVEKADGLQQIARRGAHLLLHFRVRDARGQ